MSLSERITRQFLDSIDTKKRSLELLAEPIERAVVPPNVAFFSSKTTLAPAERAPIAAATPVPPPPTTTTSNFINRSWLWKTR